MARERYRCPFCGQRMRPRPSGEGGFVYACSVCGASGPESPSKVAAQRAWKRVFLPNGRTALLGWFLLVAWILAGGV